MMCAVTWCSSAFAYRPFDSTDADVVGAGVFELEFGPVGYLKEGRDKFLVMPAAIANFGLAGDREVVIEGKLQRRIDDESNGTRMSLVDTGLFLKRLHRAGSLQANTGPSVATECSTVPYYSWRIRHGCALRRDCVAAMANRNDSSQCRSCADPTTQSGAVPGGGFWKGRTTGQYGRRLNFLHKESLVDPGRSQH